MSYSAKISTKNPMAIVVMVDQSGSMSEITTWNGVQVPKSVAVAEVINNLIDEFTSRSRSESTYRHYYDMMIIGYSGKGVCSLIPTGNSYFMTPSELISSVKWTQSVQRQRQLPDGRLVMTNIKQRIWIEPTADGRTPMNAAFTLVHQQLRKWCSIYSDSFPPIIINITDGEATDASAEQIMGTARKLKELSTEDGNVLILNVHLSHTSDKSIIFPTSKSDLPQDRYAELIFDISSQMPLPFQREISLMHGDNSTRQDYYGMAYNASISDLVRLLNIGSTTINNIVS